MDSPICHYFLSVNDGLEMEIMNLTELLCIKRRTTYRIFILIDSNPCQRLMQNISGENGETWWGKNGGVPWRYSLSSLYSCDNHGIDNRPLLSNICYDLQYCSEGDLASVFILGLFYIFLGKKLALPLTGTGLLHSSSFHFCLKVQPYYSVIHVNTHMIQELVWIIQWLHWN